MAPHLSMPRLQDVLAWLSEPGNKDTWLLLDIKVSRPTHTSHSFLHTGS